MRNGTICKENSAPLAYGSQQRDPIKVDLLQLLATEALIEMYLAGISVRRVEDFTEALWGTRVSPSTVSNLNKKIYAKIEAWRNRRIEGEHPYLYLDGIVMKRTWAGEVRNVSLLVASAVNSEGFREILGICEGAKEDKSGWSAFLRHLVDRGLNGVQLIISDACRGLMESAAEYLPDARWQRCMVHFYRNIFSHVPATKVREVSENRNAADQQGPRDRRRSAGRPDEHRGRSGRAQRPRALTYYAFPDIHWHKIRTNNPLERIMREIRRRTRVVGAFPDGQSCLNLAAARLRYIAGTAWSAKCYMNMRPLYQPQVVQTEAVASSNVRKIVGTIEPSPAGARLMLRRRVGGSPRSPQIPAVRCVDRQNPAICGVLFLWGSLSIQAGRGAPVGLRIASQIAAHTGFFILNPSRERVHCPAPSARPRP